MVSLREATVSTDTRKGKKPNAPCKDALGYILNRQVYCRECYIKPRFPLLATNEPVTPFFISTEWGYIPTCCECKAELHVTVIKCPKPELALEHNQVVGNPRGMEVATIQRWAFGAFPDCYCYEVRCADDGVMEVWHREDMELCIEGMRWK